MLKSSSKKGFTLVEVLCSLGIFSIIFICMMTYGVTYLNVRNNVKNMNNNILIMESLKNNIMHAMTFEQLEQLQKENKVFVNQENMTLDKIEISLMDVFSHEKPIDNSYIELNFLKCEYKVYNLRLSLHVKNPKDNIELQCNFYKGHYK